MLGQGHRPGLFRPAPSLGDGGAGHAQVGGAGDGRHPTQAVHLRHAAVPQVAQQVRLGVGRVEESALDDGGLGGVPAVPCPGQLDAELHAVARHASHHGGQGDLLDALGDALHARHHGVEEKAVIGGKVANHLVPLGIRVVQHPGDDLEGQAHGGGGLAVVVLVSHARRLGQHGDEVDTAALAHRPPQGRAEVVPKPAQVPLHILVVEAPAQAFGIGAGVYGGIALAAVHLVLRHHHRHTGGYHHTGRTAALMVLGGLHGDLPPLHHSPGFLLGFCQPLMDCRPADGGADRGGDLLHRQGRAGNQYRGFGHAGDHVDSGLYVRPHGTGAGQNIRRLGIGGVDLLFNGHGTHSSFLWSASMSAMVRMRWSITDWTKGFATSASKPW